MDRVLPVLKWGGVTLGGLAAVLFIVSFLLPGHVHVERSITIAAEPAEVFNVVGDLHRSDEWSPWLERDPNAKIKIEGDPGAGQKMSWASEHKNVGAGRQEVIGFVPNELMEVDLFFEGQGEAKAYFELTPVEGGSQLTWGFDTDLGMNPLMRYMGLMFDSWVGADYEKGLAKLKTVVESEA